MEKVVTEIKRPEDTVRVNAQLIALLPELEQGKTFDCILQEHKEKRSLDANSYFHVLVDKIAKSMEIGADECKIKMNLEYGALETTDTGEAVLIKLPKNANIFKITPYAKWYNEKTENGFACNYYLIYKPTHELNTKEMAKLIDGVVWEAQQLGIETKTPDELAKIKSLWGSK